MNSFKDIKIGSLYWFTKRTSCYTDDDGFMINSRTPFVEIALQERIFQYISGAARMRDAMNNESGAGALTRRTMLAAAAAARPARLRSRWRTGSARSTTRSPRSPGGRRSDRVVPAAAPPATRPRPTRHSLPSGCRRRPDERVRAPPCAWPRSVIGSRPA